MLLLLGGGCSLSQLGSSYRTFSISCFNGSYYGSYSCPAQQYCDHSVLQKGLELVAIGKSAARPTCLCLQHHLVGQIVIYDMCHFVIILLSSGFFWQPAAIKIPVQVHSGQLDTLNGFSDPQVSAQN
jgi:hypothetical protein